jgi:hypothetical protein
MVETVKLRGPRLGKLLCARIQNAFNDLDGAG